VLSNEPKMNIVHCP